MFPHPVPSRFVLPVWLILSVGCAASGLRSNAAPDAPAELRLVVENKELLDVRIYVVRGSTRVPLGVVGGFSRRELRVRPGVFPATGELRLVADPLGGTWSAVSFPIAAPVVGLLEWTIQRPPLASPIAVR